MQTIQYKGCSVYAFGLERSLKRILGGCNFKIFIRLLLIRVECFDSYLVCGLISLKMELQSSNLWPSTNTNNLKINIMKPTKKQLLNLILVQILLWFVVITLIINL